MTYRGNSFFKYIFPFSSYFS